MDKQTFGGTIQAGILPLLHGINSAWESHRHRHPWDGAAPLGSSQAKGVSSGLGTLREGAPPAPCQQGTHLSSVEPRFSISFVTSAISSFSR